MQFNAVLLLREANLKSIIEGSTLFMSAFVMELVLVYNPPLIMPWILFWTNSFGRGAACCILSIISLNGSFIVGLAALASSITVMASVIFTGNYYVPPPFVDVIIDAPGRQGTRFDTEPEKSIYNSIQLQDY